MDLVNVAHLHLLLNHVPTLGTVTGVGLFLLSLVRKSDHLQRASFEVFFIVALLTLPTYLTGVAAQGAIDGRPGVSTPSMVAHHDAALSAFLLMQLTGAAAWLALWQFRRFSRPSRATVSAFVVLAVLTTALMARAANIGGEIRHPEIVAVQQAAAADGAAAPAGEWLRSASVTTFVVEHPWIWPTAENLHFVGLCALFGVLLVVNLRILGAIKAVPFSVLHRLLPWGMLGFAVNVATGMLFFVAHPEQYTTNVAFYWKVALMLVAGANFLYLTVVDKIWILETGEDASVVDKAIAVCAIGVWAAVIYCGRMLPFLGNAA